MFVVFVFLARVPAGLLLIAGDIAMGTVDKLAVDRTVRVLHERHVRHCRRLQHEADQCAQHRSGAVTEEQRLVRTVGHGTGSVGMVQSGCQVGLAKGVRSVAHKLQT